MQSSNRNELDALISDSTAGFSRITSAPKTISAIAKELRNGSDPAQRPVPCRPYVVQARRLHQIRPAK
jgi:hypothetical protein